MKQNGNVTVIFESLRRRSPEQRQRRSVAARFTLGGFK